MHTNGWVHCSRIRKCPSNCMFVLGQHFSPSHFLIALRTILYKSGSVSPSPIKTYFKCLGSCLSSIFGVCSTDGNIFLVTHKLTNFCSDLGLSMLNVHNMCTNSSRCANDYCFEKMHLELIAQAQHLRIVAAHLQLGHRLYPAHVPMPLEVDAARPWKCWSVSFYYQPP